MHSSAALALGILAVPLVGEAQQAGKLARIGVLSSTETNFEPSIKVLREALQVAGWVEGRDLALDVRYPGEQYARLPELAAELVSLKVDVLATLGYSRELGCTHDHQNPHRGQEIVAGAL